MARFNFSLFDFLLAEAETPQENQKEHQVYARQQLFNDRQEAVLADYQAGLNREAVK